LPEAQQSLNEDYFYDEICQEVWNLMNSMEPSQVNVITVQQRMRDLKSHPDDSILVFLSQCQDLAVSTSNLPAWIGELVDKFILRQMLSASAELSSMAYRGEISAMEALDRAETRILSIRPAQRVSGDIRSLVIDAINRLEEKFNLQGAPGGMGTGLIDLDKLTDGIHPGEFIVIAAYPSTGKTALAVNIAIHNAMNKIPVSIHSAEMRPVQLVVRSLCSSAMANYHRLTEESLNRMFSVSGRISKAPIHIESAHGQTIGQVCASARRLKQKFGIKIMVVDYIQLLSGLGDNRELQVSAISKGVKSIALELDIAVLGLSQLNDEGKMRESRAIGQDADSVWKLQNDGEWQPLIQPVNLNVEKCRDGETGQVKLTFLKEYTLFKDQQKVDSKDTD